MPDIFYLVSAWKKPILIVFFLSMIAAATVTYFQPRQYLSVTTAVPASSVAADKARIFNENIQSLYSGLGSPDDLDRIIGTAKLDTVYLSVTDQFNLYDHYKITGEKMQARMKAAMKLKKYTRVLKSDYGELKVKVWDTDKNLAPQLADAILDKLGSIHRELQNTTNKNSLKSLELNKQKILALIDSIDQKPSTAKSGAETDAARRKILFDQLQQNEKLIGEYQLIVDNDPPVLLVVEKAKPAMRLSRPQWLPTLVATAFLGLFFAILLALVLEKRKVNEP